MSRSAVRAVQPVEQFFQYSLLGLLASGYFALAGSGSLDLPSIAFTGAGLLARLLLISGVIRLEFSGRAIAALTLAYIGFYPIDLFYLSREFISATVHLICFLAVIRVLTARSSRDYFFVKAIAFLELLAATLLSTSLNFFLFLTLFVIFGVATFCCSEVRRSSSLSKQVLANPGGGFQWRLAALTAAVTLGIVIMTGGLFFLLPRTAHAAFRSFVPERYHLPGFSNDVTLGQIGELKQVSTPMMHARMEAPNEKFAFKWRGTALSQFDGRRWYNPPSNRVRILMQSRQTQIVSESEVRSGSRLDYEVRIGPVDSDTLFFAGVPESLHVDGLDSVYRTAGDTYRTGSGSSEGRQYQVKAHLPNSVLASGATPALNPDEFREHLLLPASIDFRILDLARSTGLGSSSVERARSIERYLRTNFPYTTDLPQQTQPDPLAYFLFERKKGHCEYFASSMAVMLRAIQIPSRVVTGFQSGTFNPMTGWHVIRASDAHSWVEAWLPGRGWVTFDPTPPDTGRAVTDVLWSRMMLYFDTADTLWREWVVGYSLDRQIDLVARVERRSRLLSKSVEWNEELQAWSAAAFTAARPWLTYGGVIVAAGFALWFLAPGLIEQLTARRHSARVSSGKAVASDAAILYGRMLRVLRRRGLDKPAWLTPMEFAQIVPAAGQGALVEQITTAYQDLRYGGKTEAGPLMVQLLEELESSRRGS